MPVTPSPASRALALTFRPLLLYAEFNGRSGRAEFWLFTLLAATATLLVIVVEWTLLGLAPADGPGALGALLILSLLLPSAAVCTRRLHDTGRSGWWQLLILAPLVGAAMLTYWTLLRSDAGDNRFGRPTDEPALLRPSTSNGTRLP